MVPERTNKILLIYYDPSCHLLYTLPEDRGHLEMIAMNYFIPYYVNEEQSDARGVKCGWYTMDERGKLGYGPFSSPCECLGSSSQPNNAPMPMWLH